MTTANISTLGAPSFISVSLRTLLPYAIALTWAIRSRLKRPLALGALSTSIFESGLDLVIKGLIGGSSSALCRYRVLDASSAIAQVLTLVDHISLYTLHSCIIGFDPAQLSNSLPSITVSSSSTTLSLSIAALSLSRLAWSRSLWVFSSSLFNLLRSGYASFVF